MKTRILLISLLSLASLSAGCQQQTLTAEPAGGETHAKAPVAVSSPADIAMGAPAAQPVPAPEPARYSPGAAADDGVIVESRQIKREVINGPSYSKPSSGKDYLMEVESVNHQVTAKRRMKQVKAYSRPRARRVNGKGFTGYNGGSAVGGHRAPEPKTSPTKVTAEFTMAMQQPLSTFSADVDTASYSNVRRELQYGRLPSRSLVRVEEMINYFNYDLPDPDGPEPFSVTTELSDCPWSQQSKLMRIAIKTKALERGDTPPRNLVFLLDVSGSMNSPNKLPLLKKSLRTFVDTLDDNDRVSIVVYAGASGLVLPSTTGDRKLTILSAIDKLRAGGSTNGSSGIQLAYEVAQANRTQNSINRVILATDGDFNVGISSRDGLKALIEEKRKSGLFLSVLGFGRGNDRVMETLADHGNGNYASIDSLNEARKVLVKEAGATLVTVAKDVKFQVAFDPGLVKSYRLIGYKNRRLAARDFNDDKKDAGEVGAGHSVTALYELKLKEQDRVDRWLTKAGAKSAPRLATVKLRYKEPNESKSKLTERPVNAQFTALAESSKDQQWSVGVAGFGLRLEGELSGKELSHDQLYDLLAPAMASRPDEYQAEFYSLVKKSEALLK